MDTLSSDTVAVEVAPLTKEEKSKLFKAMVSVWIFAILFCSFAYFIFNSFDSFNQDSIDVVMKYSIGSIFGIALSIILFVHTRNGFQTNKTIYKGYVKDKQSVTEVNTTGTTSSKYGKSTTIETKNKLLLGTRWFEMKFKEFNQLSMDDYAEVYCICTDTIIGVKNLTVVSDTSNKGPIFAKNSINYVPEKGVEPLTAKDRIIIKAQFIRTFFTSLIVGTIAVIVLFVIGFVVYYLSVIHLQMFRFQYFNELMYLLCILLFLRINKHTINLIKDLFSNYKHVIKDKVIDKSASNVPKSSANSAVINGLVDATIKFYYLQTINSWLPVTELQYHDIKIGDDVTVHYAMFSNIILNKGI